MPLTFVSTVTVRPRGTYTARPFLTGGTVTGTTTGYFATSIATTFSPFTVLSAYTSTFAFTRGRETEVSGELSTHRSGATFPFDVISSEAAEYVTGATFFSDATSGRSSTATSYSTERITFPNPPGDATLSETYTLVEVASLTISETGATIYTASIGSWTTGASSSRSSLIKVAVITDSEGGWSATPPFDATDVVTASGSGTTTVSDFGLTTTTATTSATRFYSATAGTITAVSYASTTFGTFTTVLAFAYTTTGTTSAISTSTITSTTQATGNSVWGNPTFCVPLATLVAESHERMFTITAAESSAFRALEDVGVETTLTTQAVNFGTFEFPPTSSTTSYAVDVNSLTTLTTGQVTNSIHAITTTTTQSNVTGTRVLSLSVIGLSTRTITSTTLVPHTTTFVNGVARLATTSARTVPVVQTLGAMVHNASSVAVTTTFLQTTSVPTTQRTITAQDIVVGTGVSAATRFGSLGPSAAFALRHSVPFGGCIVAVHPRGAITRGRGISAVGTEITETRSVAHLSVIGVPSMHAVTGTEERESISSQGSVGFVTTENGVTRLALLVGHLNRSLAWLATIVARGLATVTARNGALSTTWTIAHSSETLTWLSGEGDYAAIAAKSGWTPELTFALAEPSPSAITIPRTATVSRNLTTSESYP